LRAYLDDHPPGPDLLIVAEKPHVPAQLELTGGLIPYSFVRRETERHVAVLIEGAFRDAGDARETPRPLGHVFDHVGLQRPLPHPLARAYDHRARKPRARGPLLRPARRFPPEKTEHGHDRHDEDREDGRDG